MVRLIWAEYIFLLVYLFHTKLYSRIPSVYPFLRMNLKTQAVVCNSLNHLQAIKDRFQSIIQVEANIPMPNTNKQLETTGNAFPSILLALQAEGFLILPDPVVFDDPFLAVFARYGLIVVCFSNKIPLDFLYFHIKKGSG